VSRSASRYLVVGDVHGCIDELRELLDAYRDGRRVAFVGDLVAKGPDSKGVVALARSLDAIGVRGNHDQKVLRWREEEGPVELAPEHRAVAAALDQDDWAWLLALPYHARLDDVGAIVVHGGLVPGVPLEEQRPEHELNMRSIRPVGTPSKRIGDGVPWASLWPGPELVVFGHDAVRGLQRYPHAVGLDTGCVYGGRLSGLLLPERALVQVAAHNRYSAQG